LGNFGLGASELSSSLSKTRHLGRFVVLFLVTRYGFLLKASLSLVSVVYIVSVSKSVSISSRIGDQQMFLDDTIDELKLSVGDSEHERSGE
jgi:hypothetical protein